MRQIQLRLVAAALCTMVMMMAGCGSTNVWQAALLGQYHDVERMLNENPNWVNAKDAAGRTPLMNAVKGGHERIVKLLLERGADPRVTGASNWNALHEARAGSSTPIRRMIEQRIEELDMKERTKPAP